MTQTIIDNIIQNMLPHLNSIQLKKLKETLSNELSGKTVVVSTASPYKFVETVNEVFKVEGDGLECIEKIAEITNTDVPQILYDIYNSKHQNVVWKKEEMENNLRKLIGEIDENC